MKRVKVVATGGTISAHHPKRDDLRNYVSGYYSGEQLIASIPEIQQYAEVEVESVGGMSSTVIEDMHWHQLRSTVIRALDKEGFDGVVITHGTNTLEETAYLLHLTVPTDRPIVLTGAQRPHSAMSSDSAINLFSAIRVAASDEAVGRGVLVVLNEHIHSARDVSKTSTYRLETFQSATFGALGTVEPDGTIQLYRDVTRRHTAHSSFATIPWETLPNVHIVYSYAGADGIMIRALIEAGVQGIVVAGTGAGRCSPKEEEALREARARGIPVVMSSRVGSGRVVPIETYDSLQFITADTLLPQKARILLQLTLLQTDHVQAIQSFFDTH